MAKKVKFARTDGIKPVKKNGAFNLRSPIGFRLMPGEARSIKLGISADKPMITFLPQRLKRFDGNLKHFDANEDVVAELKNEGKDPIFIEVGDTLLRAIVFETLDEL